MSASCRCHTRHSFCLGRRLSKRLLLWWALKPPPPPASAHVCQHPPSPSHSYGDGSSGGRHVRRPWKRHVARHHHIPRFSQKSCVFLYEHCKAHLHESSGKPTTVLCMAQAHQSTPGNGHRQQGIAVMQTLVTGTCRWWAHTHARAGGAGLSRHFQEPSRLPSDTGRV
jgi:hypothetical protein